MMPFLFVPPPILNDQDTRGLIIGAIVGLSVSVATHLDGDTDFDITDFGRLIRHIIGGTMLGSVAWFMCPSSWEDWMCFMVSGVLVVVKTDLRKIFWKLFTIVSTKWIEDKSDKSNKS